MILFVVLYYFLLVYAGFWLVYIIVQITRKKKLPWMFVLIDAVCIILFFYLQSLVVEHKLIFTGKYEDGSKDWGSGLANVYLTIVNLIILILIFSVTQIVFWYLFNKKFKELNMPDMTKTLFGKKKTNQL